MEINERLGLSLPEDGDFDTVAGFLLDRFGRVPTAGEYDESVEVNFEILAASPTKIDRVAIVIRDETGDEAGEKVSEKAASTGRDDSPEASRES